MASITHSPNSPRYSPQQFRALLDPTLRWAMNNMTVRTQAVERSRQEWALSNASHKIFGLKNTGSERRALNAAGLATVKDVFEHSGPFSKRILGADLAARAEKIRARADRAVIKR